MEALGQSFGYILYRATLDDTAEGELEIDAVRDYAVVGIDGAVVARLDRRFGESRAILHGAAGARLDILVENGGRINYGPDFPFERKGITGAVRLNGRDLRGWRIHSLPFEDLRGFSYGHIYRRFRPRQGRTLGERPQCGAFLECRAAAHALRAGRLAA
jgi:beta-galactosidase